uniref:Ig-like domain-containing protein n=1 Tax=Oreochromis aureus TaxID=47969 RepID=A0A668UXC6_OREAU
MNSGSKLLSFMKIILSCLSVCFSDVETSSGKRVIHKEVGDTVELSSGLPTEGVTVAMWKYGKISVADKDVGVFEKSPFKDRSELNPEDFTLTVRKLTLQDSGDFIFVSEVNDEQRPSVIINLQVHEPITKKPVIKINSTWISSNESCKVLLECSATGNVSYKWTVGKQTLTGPRQQYIIREQDGETNVTCTVSNHVSEKSAFQTVKCSKSTQQEPEKYLILFLGVAGGCLILVIISSAAVGVCLCNKRHPGKKL